MSGGESFSSIQPTNVDEKVLQEYLKSTEAQGVDASLIRNQIYYQGKPAYSSEFQNFQKWLQKRNASINQFNEKASLVSDRPGRAQTILTSPNKTLLGG